MATNPRSGRPYRRHRAQVLAMSTHCWICGRPVNKALPGTHEWGPTVDHITPLALGGHPLGPMRLAHRRCNLNRGAGPAPTTTDTPQSRQW